MKLQGRGKGRRACKGEEGGVTVVDLITEIPSNFTALTDLVERGSFKDGSNILKRPVLLMAHMAPFVRMVWDTFVVKDTGW